MKDEIEYVDNIPSNLHQISSTYQKEDQANEIETQVTALKLRKLYGGMNGDMILIDQYSAIWLKRNDQSEESKIVLKVPKMEDYGGTNMVYNLSVDNFLLDAIDFHPCPWIIGELKRYSKLGFDEIKKSIWDNYSSFNTRTEEDTKLDDQDPPDYRDRWLELSKGILLKYIGNLSTI